MNEMRVLFISGSLGLGHVTRDIAIAQELRRQLPGINIVWLATHPASLLLESVGEILLPEASQYVNENVFAEESADGSKLNLLSYLLKARGAWAKNVQVFASIAGSQRFDLVIGDETYEINLALRERPDLKRFKFVMIFDFVGLDSMTGNPFEKLGVYIWNRKWCQDYRKKKIPPYDLGLFVGELEDVPDKTFGFNLPNRRQLATAMYKPVGYIFPFTPAALSDKSAIRKKLGYGPEPLIIASIGGTSIGKELLELCGEAYPILHDKVPSLRMVLVAGPRLGIDSLKVPNGVEVRQFIPQLYEHFAACDLAIVQGGATSTLELTALRRPFIYFPIEGHTEQATVARMLERHGAGTRMSLSQTTPALLVDTISGIINRTFSYREIPTDGALKAAQLIAQLVKENN